jgi:predicted  nucleic acid-binding Zn-ribbon protein
MMTDDLVEELRKGWTEDGICENFDEDVLLVAADRIEELQRELVEANVRIEYLEDEIVDLGYEIRELGSRQ